MEKNPKPQRRLSRKEKEVQPIDNTLKSRVIEAKKNLPKSGVSSLLTFKYPELDTVKKRSLIGNVLQLRTTDQDITEKLEALAETLKKS